jgi:uncharacterized OB-fold protein
MDLAGLFSVEDGLARLAGSRCDKCGAVAFPARHVCGQCRSRVLSPVALAGRGRVVSTTHVATPPSGFDQAFEVAMIDLTEGPRVFGLLTAPATRGTSVEAVPSPVREGHLGFAFKPVVE